MRGGRGRRGESGEKGKRGQQQYRILREKLIVQDVGFGWGGRETVVRAKGKRAGAQSSWCGRCVEGYSWGKLVATLGTVLHVRS